jgi:hypothetical protein
MTETGLVSAPVDPFDALLLAEVTPGVAVRPSERPLLRWSAHPSRYVEVGNLMLWARLVALVGENRVGRKRRSLGLFQPDSAALSARAISETFPSARFPTLADDIPPGIARGSACGQNEAPLVTL